MRTIQTNVYKFNELSTEAKQKAIDIYYANNHHEGLSDQLTESLYNQIADNGITHENLELLYSLSWSQGDGVCFVGSFEYNALKVKITHDNGRYYHNKSTVKQFTDLNEEDLDNEDENLHVMEFKNLYLDICNKLEKEGYAELEYRMPEAEFNEFCEANEYEFYEDGRIL